MNVSGHRGFSLLEGLVGLVVLVLLLLGVFRMNTQARHAGTDAVIELQAALLAEEGLELAHGFGYRWLDRYAEHALSGIGPEWQAVGETAPGGEAYPPEYRQFQRRLLHTPVEVDGVRGYRVEMQVRPLAGTTAEKGLARAVVTAETVVLELAP